MPFNSPGFALFFTVVLGLYWMLGRRPQNVLLAVSSYVFYGLWDPWVLGLLFASTAVDFVAAKRIGAGRPGHRRGWLTLSLSFQLGVLGVFKYFNFFADSLGGLLSALGFESRGLHLDLVLPAGISFYTFKTMTYTIDVYRRQMPPVASLVTYATYVAFFPTLLAGPIARARDLVPQLEKPRRLLAGQAAEGAHLILWGLFKKVFVADNVALHVGRIFATPSPSGYEALVGAYLFALQIYCDFGGYSDIARGLAKCLGIELVDNFRRPYSSANPSEFWQRWHISFSTWIRDYIFLPLGGAWKGNARAYLNLGITMLLAGLWHGASWVFVLWGGYQGLLLIGHRVTQPWLKAAGRPFRKLAGKRVRRAFKVAATFHLACIGWLLFRAESVQQAWQLILALFTSFGSIEPARLMPLLWFGAPVVAIEIAETLSQREGLFRLQVVPVWVRAAAYAVLTYLLVFRGAATQGFIYMQF